MYAGPKRTSKPGRRVWMVDANASAVADRREPSYSRPALKKYGDLLDRQHRTRSILCEVEVMGSKVGSRGT